MMVDFLPSQFLINVVRKVQRAIPNQPSVESDFLLRAIRIKNTTDKIVHITKYVFDLKAKGRSKKQILYSRESVQERSTALSEFAEKFLNVKEGYREIFRKGNVHALFGTGKFWDKDRLSTTITLDPGQETGFMDEHFRVAANDPIDELVFIVFYIEDNEEKNTQIRIPVIQYENENQYIFPVTGVWRVTGNWDGPESHRSAYSQEFAFDLDQLDSSLQVVLNQKKPNEEYRCYGKEVVAVADGEVVDCFDQLPENPGSCSA